MLKLAVLASGRGSNFKALADASRRENSGFEIALLVSDHSDAGALDIAEQLSIPHLHLDPEHFASRREFETELVSHFSHAGIGLIALAGYMRLAGKTLLRAFPGRIINIHPSLLPSFPGLEAQKQALNYGVRVSGCTVHFVDSGMDTGPIILQRSVPVLCSDTVSSLSERILVEEHRAYPEAVSLIASGRVGLNGRTVMIQKEGLK
ncbi:MAG: phosphoribosylglycinamide formyltransferase [Candidatus Wallbacteria bacterium]|nr:phosphoribosylglycinamide formyltransferase [Candidatus Wallbacteria bacterium]